MRGRSSPKQVRAMEVEKVDKLKKQEPHLSGAYIRSLVKQLTSSRTKDPLNPASLENSTNLDDSLCSDTQLSPQQPPPPAQLPPPQIKKKQVRRRLHTSRPYQERLLNMAEARREIVTALKFHRASMKQQQQQQSQTTGPQSWPQESSGEEQGKSKSRRNPRIYASNTMNNNNFPSYNNMENFSNSTTFPCLPPQYPYSSCPFGSQLPLQDHLNFPLPNQTLGLNLNFHDFCNLDATPYYSSSSSSNNNSIFSSSSPSSSSDEFHYVGGGVPIAQMVNSEDSKLLHPSMDDQEMAEIRSIGEQHEMEWNDTLNLATSAWWFKFLKAMEIEPEHDEKNIGEEYGCYPFDEVMEFPAWFNPNETCLQQHVDDTYSHPTLPCMEIEEIEGMDTEWLA